MNDGGIHNHAFPQQQTLFVLPYPLEELCSQVMFLQEVAERQNRAGIRNPSFSKGLTYNSAKLPSIKH